MEEEDRIYLNPDFDKVYKYFPWNSNFSKEYYDEMRILYPNYFHKYTPNLGPRDVYYKNSNQNQSFVVFQLLVKELRNSSYLKNISVDDLFLYYLSINREGRLLESLKHYDEIEKEENKRKRDLTKFKDQLAKVFSEEKLHYKFNGHYTWRDGDIIRGKQNLSLPFNEIVFKGLDTIEIKDPGIIHMLCKCLEQQIKDLEPLEDTRRKNSLKVQIRWGKSLFNYLKENTIAANSEILDFVGRFFEIINFPFTRIRKTKDSGPVYYPVYLEKLFR